MTKRSTLDRTLLLRDTRSRKALGLAITVGVALSGLVVAQAVILATILGDLVNHHGLSQTTINIFILVTAGRFIVSSLGEHLSANAAATSVAQLRHDLLETQRSLALRELTLRQRGRMVLEATRGLRKLESFYARYVPSVVVAAIAPLVALVFLGIRDWPSLLIALGLLAVLPPMMIHFGRKANAMSAVQWSRLGSLSARTLSIIRATPSLKSLGELDGAREELSAIASATATSIVATLRVAFLSSAGLEFLSGVGVGLVAMLAGFRLVNGSLSITTAFAIVLITPEVFVPLRRAGAAFHEASEGRAAGEATLAILKQASTSTPGLTQPSSTDIALRDVWLSGMNTDVSLTLADGEHLIVRGPSGSGKSTLIALIAGLNTPERGSITIGASNLADLDLAWWRSRIGFVPQRPHLFSGSLRDNVLLGAKAGDTEIARLLESLGLTRLMARGLDTHLGEAAVGVSGGELQRIALARVLLSPRQWLLLDEPVAHLDPSHVDLVRTALTSRLDRLGVIEVAHGATLLDTTTPTLTMETLEATP